MDTVLAAGSEPAPRSQRRGRRGPYIQGQTPSAGPKPRVVLEALRGAKTVNGLGSPVGAACRDEASRRLQYFWRGLSGLIGRTLLTCGFVAGVRAVASRAVKKLQPSGGLRCRRRATVGRRASIGCPSAARSSSAELLSGRWVKLAPSIPSK